MGIISKLKSVIGITDGEGRRTSDAGTAVTVEREPAASAERAVKGVDPAPTSATDRPDATTEEPPADDGDTSPVDGEPVDTIKGIGPAYADRLRAAGVHSVADLAAADAATLASETDLGAGRVENWIERARARTR